MAYQVWRTAFDQTVMHMAFLAESRSAGAWITDDRVDQALIQSGPWSPGGVFNEERYRATSNAEKYSYRKLFREQLLDEQVQRDLLVDPRFSTKEIDFFKGMISAQRKFSFVELPLQGLPRRGAEGLRGEEPGPVPADQAQPDPGQVQREGGAGDPPQAGGPRRQLRGAGPRPLQGRLRGEGRGRRLALVLTTWRRDFEAKEPLEAVMGLAEGALSGVLKSRYGWMIYRCDSPALRPDFTDAETLRVARGYMMRYEKGQVEDWFVKKAEAFRLRARDIGFLGAALTQDLKAQQTDFFPLNFQGLYFLAPVRGAGQDADLSSAATNEDFFLKAFRLAPGDVSEPVLLDDQVIVLKLDEVRKAPEEQLALTEEYYAYFARQALEADLQAALLKPEYLKDNFHETFYTYVFTAQPTPSE